MTIRHIVAALIIGCVSPFSWAAENKATPTFQLITESANADLKSFVLTAVTDNPRVSAANFALNASKFSLLAAGKPLYNPELDFESENTEIETRTIGISQTFDWSGKRSAQKKVSAADHKRALEQYRQVWQDVSIDVLSALADKQTSLERRELTAKQVSLMQRFYELAEKRYEIGDLSLIELNLAKLVYSDARMQGATSAAEAVDKRQTLLMLSFNNQESERPTLGTNLEEITKLIDPQTQILSLPSIRAAQFRLESSKALVLLRKKQKRVDPTIGILGGKEGDESLVGLTFSIPIPIRNTYKNEEKAANQLFLQEEQLFINVRRRAQSRLNSAHSRYQIALDAWQDWLSVGQSGLEQQHQQLSQLWTSGDLSTTDFLVQANQTINTQNSALELRHSLWQAWFEWLAASGQVNRWLGFQDSNYKQN